MSDYVNTLLVRQHQKDIQQEFAAQRLANLARGERARRQSSIRPLARSLQMAMITLGRGLALRGLWMSQNKAKLQPIEAETLVPDCC